jgi:hypothetical protein
MYVLITRHTRQQDPLLWPVMSAMMTTHDEWRNGANAWKLVETQCSGYGTYP